MREQMTVMHEQGVRFEERLGNDHAVCTDDSEHRGTGACRELAADARREAASPTRFPFLQGAAPQPRRSMAYCHGGR
jgi:hypothetical protein